jgi:hypothetical protein
MIEKSIVTNLSGLVKQKKLSVPAYLKQCAYLGISLTMATAAIGLVAKADASTGDSHEATMSALANIVSAHEAGDIASILREGAPTGAETDLAQWYDWGDWVDWGDWGDWADWGDWVDWGDWGDWADWGDWIDWGDWGDWVDWGDWSDWADWGDWVDWGDWSDWGDWWN